jgi:hypothetical protein
MFFVRDIFVCSVGIQVKADLIGLREADLLVPAAGPGASEVLHLLRPAVSKLKANVASAPAAASVPQSLVENRKMSTLASESFSMAAATLEAAAAAVFGNSEQVGSTSTTQKSVEALFGLSCIFSACGVCSGEVMKLLHTYTTKVKRREVIQTQGALSLTIFAIVTVWSVVSSSAV